MVRTPIDRNAPEVARMVFLRWPFGDPLGESFNIAQQKTVLIAAFEALNATKTPGEIVALPFRWRKEKYSMDKAVPKTQLDDKPESL